MLNKKEIEEIREHLEKSQNPIFFFDNDPDGLCSFLLLQRYLGMGKGVAIRGSPELSKDYFRKAIELNSDYIFILDKPLVSKEFFEEVDKVNIPVVWIDHHDVQKEIPSFVSYYNPKKEINYPTAYLCYQVTKRKEDLWIAVIGCISEYYIPDYYKDFREKYPDLSIEKYSNPFDILFNSKIGRIERLFRFGLKDKTTNVLGMIRFLVKIKSPYDVLEESEKNYLMHKRFNHIDKTYKKLIKKGMEIGGTSEEILFFKYGGDLSISSDLSNELVYLFPNKLVVVAYIDENKGKANISIRGEKVKGKILKILEDFENSTGGGHENAVGVQIKKDDLEKFHNSLVNYFNRKI